MEKFIKSLFMMISFCFALACPGISFADKCDVSCKEGSNAIECPGGCGCYCQDDKAICSCYNETEKSCDVSCSKGNKAITCTTGGCGCYCDADGTPVCDCYKGGKK